MWKKYGTTGQPTRDYITRRMRIASWIIKAPDTHTEYLKLIAFPRQHWSRERTSGVTLYLRCLSCSFVSALCVDSTLTSTYLYCQWESVRWGSASRNIFAFVRQYRKARIYAGSEKALYWPEDG
jgi:hypothetical protein